MEDEIGFILRLAQIAVSKDVAATLRPFGLRPADFSILRAVAATPGLRQQDVAQLVGIKQPNLTGVLDQLCRRDLVDRAAVRGNRRSNALRLTKAGRVLLDQVESVHQSHRRRVREALGFHDPGELVIVLHRLARLGSWHFMGGTMRPYLQKRRQGK